MERLTERTAVGILVKEDYGENVLRTLYSCYGEKPNPHYTNCEEGYCAIEKLAAYEDAEEQGLLLRLPCKVGDTVCVKMDSSCKMLYAEAEVRDFAYFLSCGFCVVITSKHFDKQSIPFSEFGKTFFRSEAEAKLKEMEDSNDRK